MTDGCTTPFPQRGGGGRKKDDVKGGKSLNQQDEPKFTMRVRWANFIQSGEASSGRLQKGCLWVHLLRCELQQVQQGAY